MGFWVLSDTVRWEALHRLAFLTLTLTLSWCRVGLVALVTEGAVQLTKREDLVKAPHLGGSKPGFKLRA